MMLRGIPQKGKDMLQDNVQSSKRARTLVLVGRAGNGKSATGNSILGRKAFKQGSSSVGVTKTCELQTTQLADGQIINVIDTPGLSALSTSSQSTTKEILRCLTLAKQGIDAVLFVFSVMNRISQEEEDNLRLLQALFGSEIVNYIIIVFTGGDNLEEGEDALEEYLSGCPKFLKEVLDQGDKPLVLFDNTTQDKHKKTEQVQKLLTVVDSVVKRNGGKPYMDELFSEPPQMKTQLGGEKDARIERWANTAPRGEGSLSKDEIHELRMMLDKVPRRERSLSKDEINELRMMLDKEKDETQVHEIQRKYFIPNMCKFL